MFKGYGKVNSILHEKLNSVSEIRNMSSHSMLKSQDLNVIEKTKSKKKVESSSNFRVNCNDDITEDYNFDRNFHYLEEKEKYVNINPEKSSKKNDKEESNNQKTNSNFYNNDNSKSGKKVDEANNKKNNNKKTKKQKKSDYTDPNKLHMHVDHFPKPIYKTVKMRDQVTEMPNEANTLNTFLTQKISEIDSSAAKRKRTKDLKSRKNTSYISDISQVNQIKFFAFEVKNAKHKEHFNNKIVQIEKEILKEINQINKEQANTYNAELEKTEDFFDLDKSKVFDFTKRHKSASNPNFYGRPTSKQNFKTNPGLIRGFLRNFKNNKLLSEFFKYKMEKDKRERFNLQSNDFGSSQILRNSNTNNDYVETYFIGKNINGTIKKESLTQNNFYKKNEIENMRKYYEIIKNQRNNQEDEVNDFNNLNQDLYINREFIKEFNEYALNLANSKLNSEQKPNLNEDLNNQFYNLTCLNRNAELNKIDYIKDLKHNSNNIHRIDEATENNEQISFLNRDQMDKNFNCSNSKKSKLSPKTDFASYSPCNSQNSSHKKNKKFSNLNKFDEKYLEENFYEEPIDEGEAKKVMFQVNNPKFKNMGSFVKVKEKAFFRQITNNDDPNKININSDQDSNFLENLNQNSINLNNKNLFKKPSNKDEYCLEDKKICIDDENNSYKKKSKSQHKARDKNVRDPNMHLNFEEEQYLILNENMNDKNLFSDLNTHRGIKTCTNENPTEILQSGLSYEENNRLTKQEVAEGLFSNEENVNIQHEDFYEKQFAHKALSPPCFSRASLQENNSTNSIYDNFEKRNKIINNNYLAYSIQSLYYKPVPDKNSKNYFRNMQKNKFNRLKEIVFGPRNEEYKQKMIIDNNAHLNNASSNKNSILNNKPTNAPAIKKTKSPLRSIINNQMGLIIKNHNIY